MTPDTDRCPLCGARVPGARTADGEFLPIRGNTHRPACPNAKPPTASKPGDWMENLQNVADLGHFAGGYAIFLTTIFWTHSWLAIGIVEVVFLGLVAWKEGYYDLRDETGETVSTSLEDAVGWISGNSVGWIMLAAAHAVGSW